MAKASDKIIEADQISEHIDKRIGELTYSEFGERTGITRQNLYAIRKGIHVPTARSLRALGLEPCYRVLDESPMKSTKQKPAPKPLTPQAEIRALKRQNRELKKKIEEGATK